MRLIGSAVFASMLAACATPQGDTGWTPDMLFGVSSDGRDYSDFLSARYAGLTGDAPAAALYYHRAYSRAPLDPAALEAAVLAYLIEGDAASAASLAVNADPAVAKASPSAQLAIVADDLANGRTRKARDRLSSVRIGALNADLVDFLHAWLAGAKKTDDGLNALERNVASRTQAAETNVMRAFILSSAGRRDEALAAVEQGPPLRIASPLQISLHARLIAATGDLARARDLLRAYDDVAGPSPETSTLAAMFDAGEPIAALKYDVTTGAAASVQLAATGRFSRMGAQVAIMRHTLALHIDPGFEPARLSLAAALEEQGRFDAAAATLEQVAVDSPLRPHALIALARLYAGLDQPDDALAAAHQARALSQQRDVILSAGDIYRGVERFVEAEASYDAVVQSDAASGRVDWRVLFARAAARERLGRWDEAEADLLAALGVEPQRPELQNFLGYGWVDRGKRVDEGMALIRSAAAARPDSGYIIDSLGWAHYRLGEFEAAIMHLERAVELAPDDAEIVDHLGDAYWRTGRERDAAFQWRRALSFSPDAVLEAGLRAKLANGLALRTDQANAIARTRP